MNSDDTDTETNIENTNIWKYGDEDIVRAWLFFWF